MRIAGLVAANTAFLVLVGGAVYSAWLFFHFVPAGSWDLPLDREKRIDVVVEPLRTSPSARRAVQVLVVLEPLARDAATVEALRNATANVELRIRDVSGRELTNAAKPFSVPADGCWIFTQGTCAGYDDAEPKWFLRSPTLILQPTTVEVVARTTALAQPDVPLRGARLEVYVDSDRRIETVAIACGAGFLGLLVVSVILFVVPKRSTRAARPA